MQNLQKNAKCGIIKLVLYHNFREKHLGGSQDEERRKVYLAVNEEHARFCNLCGTDWFCRLLSQQGTELAHWSHYGVPECCGKLPDGQLGCCNRGHYRSYSWWHGF